MTLKENIRCCNRNLLLQNRIEIQLKHTVQGPIMLFNPILQEQITITTANIFFQCHFVEMVLQGLVLTKDGEHSDQLVLVGI
jgi:hypothetical protein